MTADVIALRPSCQLCGAPDAHHDATFEGSDDIIPVCRECSAQLDLYDGLLDLGLSAGEANYAMEAITAYRLRFGPAVANDDEREETLQ